MIDFFNAKDTIASLKKPHFWAITAITLFLIFIYTLWPWRETTFEHGVGRWFGWLASLEGLALFELKCRLTGSLFILSVIYATIVYKWKGAVIISLLSLVYSLLFIGIWTSIDSIVRNSTLLLLPAAIIVAVTIEMELRRKDRRFFAEREAERQMYLSKMIDAQEMERQRLAQELHDETIQMLLATASYAEALESSDKDDIIEIKRKAAWIKGTTRRTVDDLRRISLDLRPSVLDNLGLVPALKWLIKGISEESGINTQLVTRGLERKLSPSVEVTVFRVAQEALNNIKRHSKAKQAVITLEAVSEYLVMTIQDDGRGFVPPKRLANLVTGSNLGLIGMQERIRSIGGTFKIRSKPSEGTLLSFRIPI